MIKQLLQNRPSSFYLFCLLIILLQFLQIGYFKAFQIIKPYDVSYWKDRIEHSQWVLPASNRSIGDDGLYSYVGYRLAKGDSPANLNTETPPFAKYLIGFSITTFGSAGVYSSFAGIASLILFYLLVRKVIVNRDLQVFTVSAFVLNALFISQFWNAWIDIAQLFLLLLNIVLLLKYDETGKKNYILLAASGFALGLFFQTKTPVLFPIILILELLYLYIVKRVRTAPVFLASVTVGILIVYARYFMVGNSLLDFIKLQKYIFSFFMKSELPTHIGAIWSILISGKFPDIVTGRLQSVEEWTIIWPLITIVGVVSAVYFILKPAPLFVKGLSLFLFAGLAIYSLIPSYPRYLLILIPFLYIFVGIFIEKYKHWVKHKIILILFLILGLASTTVYLLPSPNDVINTFTHSYSNQFFKDIYVENLSHGDLSIPMEEFNQINKKALSDGAVRDIKVELLKKDISKFSKSGKATFLFTYKTQNLGGFSEEKQVTFIQSRGEWKILWGWDLLLKGFKPGHTIETRIMTGRRGDIEKDNAIVATDATGFLISINPSLIEKSREEEMLKNVEKVTGMHAVDIHNAYSEDILPGTYIPIATNFEAPDKNIYEKLPSFRGIKLTPYVSRLYDGVPPDSISNTFFEECCTRIYSSYNYHGVSGPEKIYDKRLSGYDGGTLLIKDQMGNIVRTVIDKKPKNGENIYLDSQ